jgi:hypothetical protein
MHIVLFVLSGLALLCGFGTTASAQGAIHQVYAGVFYVIAAVLLSGAAVVEAVNRLRRELVVSRVRHTQPAPQRA